MELSYPGKITEDELFSSVQPASVKTRAVYGPRKADWRNSLYFGDNLGVLRKLVDVPSVQGQVSLVYIDPPYSTQQNFRHRKQLDTHAYADQLSGFEFIEFLRQRLIFLRELLADDGSIYVHLDTNMVFHIKVIMDEIFGERNFRNLIARKKCHSKNYTRKQYGNVTDYILLYSKTSDMKWNRPYEEENIYSFEQRFPRVDDETGRRYALVPIYAPGVRNGETGKPWRGKLPPKGKHWQVPPSELERLDCEGHIYWSPTGNPRRKIYADESNGVPVQDIWTKFMDFRNQNMKETGYPTEKNYALLRRIIEASSNPGDLVLDCFAGSGTTLAMAQELGRRWIGVDASELAIDTAIERIQHLKDKPALTQEQMNLFDSHESEECVISIYETFQVLEDVMCESNQPLDVLKASSM